MSNPQASIELWFGAKEGNFAKVQKAIGDGANINMHTNQWVQTTPLHEAAYHMPQGAPPDCPHMRIIQLLIDSGAEIDARSNNYGMTPLHYAITNRGHRENDYHAANLLIDNGADLDAYDTQGETAFQKLALKMRQFQDEDGFFETLNDVSAAAGLIKTIEKAVDKGADLNIQTWGNINLCHILNAEAHYAIPTVYTPQGQQYTGGVRMPLLRLAQFLESKGGESYIFGLDNSKKLIEATLSQDPESRFAMGSALQGDKFCAKGDPGARQGSNYAPLMSELIYRLDILNAEQIDWSFQQIKVLVHYGADVNAVDKNYLSTPLYYLLFDKMVHMHDANHPCAQKVRAIADHLISKGADVHAVRCDGGKNFCQLNSERGNNPLVRDFLEANGCTTPTQWELL